MKYPTVAIVIINWNNFSDIKECLESLDRITYSNYEVIVVDNASRDDSVEKLRREFPQHTVIRNLVNKGFAGGCNVGIRYALDRGIDYILLLNDDTVVEKGFLEPAVEAMINNEKLGIVCGKIYYHSTPRVIWSAGGVMKSWITGTPFSIVGHNEIDVGQFDEKRSIDWCVGALMLIPRSVFEKVGLLPDCYFLCMEEGDFAVQVRRAGFELSYVPDSIIWHKVGVSGNISIRSIYNNYRNRLLFMERNTPLLVWWGWLMLFKAYTFCSLFLFRKVPRIYKGIDHDLLMRIIQLAFLDHKSKKTITEDDLNHAERTFLEAA
jgi:GT2 family glycosyltransferase